MRLSSSLRSSVIFGWVLALLSLSAISDVLAQSGKGAISWKSALRQEADWYGSEEAVRIAKNVLLYQQANGGWEKNIDMAKVLSEEEIIRLGKEKEARESNNQRTTIDNGASYTQVRFLARVYEATEKENLSQGMVKGLDYLLAAQYENGGWPQYYPVREGYYEHITFNDGAMIGVMRLLRDVAEREFPFEKVDPARRELAAAAIEKGLQIILKTQIEVEGELTAWCAQYDRNDLFPVKARAYELPSICGSESVGIVRYLMEIEEPNAEIRNSIEQAVRWLDRVKLTEIRVIRKEDSSLPRGFDRIVGLDPEGSSPVWARFYEIGTNYPMFVGRDGIVRYALSEIEHERRVGYAWFGGWAREILEKEYPAWRQRWLTD